MATISRRGRGLALVFVLAGLSACSSVRPHPDLVDSATRVGAISRVELNLANRWTLPRFCSVRLVWPGGQVAESDAAIRAGLQTHLNLVDSDPQFELMVRWDAPATPQATLMHDLTGWVPRPTPQHKVSIDVFVSKDQRWLQRVDLEVQPGWFGRSGGDPVLVEAAFRRVSAKLVGHLAG